MFSVEFSNGGVLQPLGVLNALAGYGWGQLEGQKLRRLKKLK
ncbi:MAG: hypothetical protein PHV61_09745 [Limnochordia bacterium]|nr:hypothetical protein [Limnochordia bacterium]MDD4517937.1 hypothetical protein [Limnochordia bacterium]